MAAVRTSKVGATYTNMVLKLNVVIELKKKKYVTLVKVFFCRIQNKKTTERNLHLTFGLIMILIKHRKLYTGTNYNHIYEFCMKHCLYMAAVRNLYDKFNSRDTFW
jgi:hypothetical protein